MFNFRPKLNVVATILAKNEEDIIGANIEHHVEQGVTQIILTDNGSTDRTKEIAAKYPEVIEIIDEPGDDHRQSEWVTRMARLACKLNPDWIIHLDADELWCNLGILRHCEGPRISCEGVFLHLPFADRFDLHEMRHYLDLSPFWPMPQECKVAHRPDPNIAITHGNHGFVGQAVTDRISGVDRHHYPIRGFDQLVNKAIKGHMALQRRNSACERWKRWHDSYRAGKMALTAADLWMASWRVAKGCISREDWQTIYQFWCEPEVITFFDNSPILPFVGEWPVKR